MGRLDGRAAIVTGAGRGIGAAYARRFAEEGAKVCVADIIDGAETVAAIKKAGGEAFAVRCDVSSEAQTKAMVAATVEAYGRLDVVVANAANVAVFNLRSIVDLPADEWDQVMAVNLRGVWLTLKAAVPEMKKRKYGKIITISSTTTHMGVPFVLHYVTSKGGINAMTRALARELGDDGIRVNAIAPGLTMSDIFEANPGEITETKFAFSRNLRSFKRDQVPGDLVGAAVFLASAESDFMSGQTIVVDGGAVMH